MRMKLLKPHTHDSKPCVPGDEIDVSKPVADWLKARGISEPSKTTTQRPDQTPTSTSAQEI